MTRKKVETIKVTILSFLLYFTYRAFSFLKIGLLIYVCLRFRSKTKYTPANINIGFSVIKFKKSINNKTRIPRYIDRCFAMEYNTNKSVRHRIPSPLINVILGETYDIEYLAA